MIANTQRVLTDLHYLRSIGAYKTGVHRPTLSADDMIARKWLADQLRAIGHTSTIDGIANVYGRVPSDGPIVLAGSHIESQNHAGWLDGALGVVYALEAARVAKETGLSGGVDVIAFADEESHFSGASFLGSESFAGDVSEEVMDGSVCRSGRGRLRDLLADAGLAGRERLKIETDRYKAFFEAHIEQGQTLETEDLKIGVVTSIVAIWQYRITFKGIQNHAGTTKMAIRRDAGKALMGLWHRIEEEFPNICGPHSVWTVGHVSISPGQPSIIPGCAEMIVQFRDAEPATLDRLKAKLYELVREADDGPCAVTIEVMGESTPAHMSKALQSTLIDAARTHAPDKWLVMPSGAGHDAQVIAPLIPSAMMFVPSIGGISHHWTENTSDKDIALGAQVFVDAIGRVLSGSG
ncbi:Zn-dependent hydrolase [Chromatiales bacterium (ex Bugula neritina AB1)]|nr:Zn-dependent hydrolase [Chromatiales bacterium (ex Bugula neritina AB1)]